MAQSQQVAFSTAQPYLARNAHGYTKYCAATHTWLCMCRFRKMTGITRDIGLIIARLIYASRGWSCWSNNDDDGEDDANTARRTK